MRLPLWLYVDKESAIEAGMTHEGRLFGVPAWLREDSDSQVTASPKVPALHLWCMGVDLVLEIAAAFVQEDRALESPITLGRRIAP
ncbi:hypothetical protein I5W23_04365 [Stenotrophomonas maltophilia]|nr:hypothetical protein [Stenotrophomonas maltophilia]